MPRDREASLRPERLQGLALPLVLGAAAIVAALLALQAGAWALFAALALLLTAAACLLTGALWTRQREQARLHDARQQHQLLLQLSDCWAWQTDADHRLVRLQPPAAAPASAWAEGAFSGQRLWERFATGEAGLQARMEAHAALPELRARQPLAQGGERCWLLRGLPRLDSQGRFAGYLGLARPVEAAEPAAVPAAREADAQADAQAAAQAHAELQALAAEHAAFSYSVSHDLRAPIRVVEGFARILKEDYGRALDRIGNDHLDRVLSAAARMNSMIDAMLSLSRLSTQPLQRQPVNLSQLAGFIADDLRRQSPERQVRVHIAPDLLVQGDPTLLRMVLDNLLGNAWKYTARAAEPQIWFGRDADREGNAFVVRDNGAGFDMRFADRLFGVFQRLHSANDFPGTGVGLATVRRIVRRHGGEIWAEAEVDRGASFHFTLS